MYGITILIHHIKGLGPRIVQKKFFRVGITLGLLCAKLCPISSNFHTFSCVDNHFSKLAARNFKLYMPYERPHSSDGAEEIFLHCRNPSACYSRNFARFRAIFTRFHVKTTISANWLHEISSFICHMKGLIPVMVQKKFFALP